MILEYATFIPGELGVAEWTGDYDKLQLGRAVLCDGFLSKNVWKDISNRPNLSLVSRLWRDLMLSILYRSIIVDHPDTVPSVVSLMERNPDFASLVRRVDLLGLESPFQEDHLDDESTSPTPEQAFGHLRLRQLISKFANLVSLHTGDITGRLTSHLLEGIGTDEQHWLSNSSLQQVIAATSPSKSPALLSNLSPLNSLRALQIVPSDLWKEPETELACISLPLLEVIEFCAIDFTEEFDSFLSNSSMPRLHTVSVSIGESDPHFLTEFWKTFGPQICTLCINRDAEYKDLLHTGCDMFLNSVVKHLPNLEQLIMECVMHADLLSEISRYSTIRSVQLHPRYGLALEYLGFDPFQVDVTAQFSKLERFGISNLPYENDLRRDGLRVLDEVIIYLDACQETMHSRGISFSMSLGNGQIIDSKHDLHQIWEVPKAIAKSEASDTDGLTNSDC